MVGYLSVFRFQTNSERCLFASVPRAVVDLGPPHPCRIGVYFASMCAPSKRVTAVVNRVSSVSSFLSFAASLLRFDAIKSLFCVYTHTENSPANTFGLTSGRASRSSLQTFHKCCFQQDGSGDFRAIVRPRASV